MDEDLVGEHSMQSTSSLFFGVKLDDNFTPKQIAFALRVSESSVKRWCDQGVIRTDRTLGGHRRIPLEYLLEFLETTNRRVVDPVAIGMEQLGSQLERIPSEHLAPTAILAQFEQALMQGSEGECRRMISSWYSAHRGMASLADDLVCPVFRSIGKLWKSGEIDIYQERRGSEITLRLILELRRLLPEPKGMAPLAMGGTPGGDQYQLPSQLVEMVFREQGWRTAGLGSNIPFSSLLSAARKHMPKVFWLSISHVEETESFILEYADFVRRLPKGITLVLGGCAMSDDLRPRMEYAAYCDGMRQLASLVKTLKSGH